MLPASASGVLAVAEWGGRCFREGPRAGFRFKCSRTSCASRIYTPPENSARSSFVKVADRNPASALRRGESGWEIF